MMEIEKPKFTVEENSDFSYCKVVAEPLERGFGITLGNALRRILLSSLPGAAVQGIKIQGVRHEFSTVPGIKEDVAEIVLNLKELAIKTSITDMTFKKTINLSAKGPRAVTAKDFPSDSDFEVLNKDALICTIDEGGVLDHQQLPEPGSAVECSAYPHRVEAHRVHAHRPAHHHRDRLPAVGGLLLRRGLSPAVPGEESERLLRHRRHRRELPDRVGCGGAALTRGGPPAAGNVNG